MKHFYCLVIPGKIAQFMMASDILSHFPELYFMKHIAIKIIMSIIRTVVQPERNFYMHRRVLQTSLVHHLTFETFQEAKQPTSEYLHFLLTVSFPRFIANNTRISIFGIPNPSVLITELYDFQKSCGFLGYKPSLSQSTTVRFNISKCDKDL